MKKYLLIFAVITAFMVSCEKENDVLETTSTENKVETVTIEGIEVGSENGYLVLNNISDAINLAEVISKFGINNATTLTKFENFKSARIYFEEKNEEAIISNNENIMKAVLNELKQKGYYNEVTNCVEYPFNLTNWASVLNQDGIVKIENTVYRFLGSDKLYVEDNNVETLLKVKSKSDYEKYGVLNSNNKFPKLKSLTINGSGELLPYDLVEYNTVAGTEYRVTSNLWYLAYCDEFDRIYRNEIFIESHLHFKNVIWWRYNDYYYSKKCDVEIGGNNASTDGIYSHTKVSVHNNYPPYVCDQLQNWAHQIRFTSQSFPRIDEDDFLYPDIDQVVSAWHTIKVPQTQWCVEN